MESRKRLYARFLSIALRQILWHIAGMANDDAPTDLLTAIGARLRAVQKELDETDGQMAKRLGVLRTVWNNWTRGVNMPKPQAMITLCEQESLSLEWIYRGIGDHMPADIMVRLELWMAGINPTEAKQADAERVLAQVAQRLLNTRRRKAPAA